MEKNSNLTLEQVPQEISPLAFLFQRYGKGLVMEINRRKSELKGSDRIISEVEQYCKYCASLFEPLSYRDWSQLLQEYKNLVHEKAALLNKISNISRPYENMEKFWADADQQALGASPFTFWDTYEHGRRRQLEFSFAKAYGSKEALLLNSGMSAIAVAIGMMNLKPGDKLLTGERCYFETSEYLRDYVQAKGIELIRCPVDDNAKSIELIKFHQPDVVLVETVTNAPGVQALSNIVEWQKVSPKSLFIIDNSVQSFNTQWFEKVSWPEKSHILVVESATKYITQECMAGVIYGYGEMMNKARDYARATGQQLQEKAFNYINEQEILLANEKLSIHTTNIRDFVEILHERVGKYLDIRPLDSHTHRLTPYSSNQIFDKGLGALVFISFKDHVFPEKEQKAKAHRVLLESWCQRVRHLNIQLPVKAGFGWNHTSARVYESGKLNQDDAPVYLRVTIGLEPKAVIHKIAELLAKSTDRIVESNNKK